MKKLYSIAALSSIVGKIHLSKVKQITNRSTTSSSRRLMNTATIGESHLRDLNQNRIESSNFEFYEAIKKNKLHNFGTAIVAKIMKVRGKDIAIKIEWETHQITRDTENLWDWYKEVLHHEVSSVPMAFSNPDTAPTLCKRQQRMILTFTMGWFYFRNYQLFCQLLVIYLISW